MSDEVRHLQRNLDAEDTADRKGSGEEAAAGFKLDGSDEETAAGEGVNRRRRDRKRLQTHSHPVSLMMVGFYTK